MGGKKPVEKNREWEKGRRDKLNQKFAELSRLLPDHDPSINLSKMEILNRAAQYIKTLQQQNQDILNDGKQSYLDMEVDKLQQRVAHLVFKTKLLVDALRNAGVPIPEVKPPRKRKRQLKQSDSPPDTSVPASCDINRDDAKKDVDEILNEQNLNTNLTETALSIEPLSSKVASSNPPLIKGNNNLQKSFEDATVTAEQLNVTSKNTQDTFKSQKNIIKILKEPLKEINSTLPSVNIPKDTSSVSQAPQQVALVSAEDKQSSVLSSSIPGVITSIGQSPVISNFSLFDRTSLVNLGPGTLILADGRVVNVPPPLPQIVVKPQPTLILMQKTIKKEKRLYPKQVDVTRTTYTNKAPIPSIKHFNLEFKSKRKIKVTKTRLSPKQIKRKETINSKVVKTSLVKVDSKINKLSGVKNKIVEISAEQVKNVRTEESIEIQEISKTVEHVSHKQILAEDMNTQSLSALNQCNVLTQNKTNISDIDNVINCNVKNKEADLIIINDTNIQVNEVSDSSTSPHLNCEVNKNPDSVSCSKSKTATVFDTANNQTNVEKTIDNSFQIETNKETLINNLVSSNGNGNEISSATGNQIKSIENVKIDNDFVKNTCNELSTEISFDEKNEISSIYNSCKSIDKEIETNEIHKKVNSIMSSENYLRNNRNLHDKLDEVQIDRHCLFEEGNKKCSNSQECNVFDKRIALNDGVGETAKVNCSTNNETSAPIINDNCINKNSVVSKSFTSSKSITDSLIENHPKHSGVTTGEIINHIDSNANSTPNCSYMCGDHKNDEYYGNKHLTSSSTQSKNGESSNVETILSQNNNSIPSKHSSLNNNLTTNEKSGSSRQSSEPCNNQNDLPQPQDNLSRPPDKGLISDKNQETFTQSSSFNNKINSTTSLKTNQNNCFNVNRDFENLNKYVVNSSVDIPNSCSMRNQFYESQNKTSSINSIVCNQPNELIDKRNSINQESLNFQANSLNKCYPGQANESVNSNMYNSFGEASYNNQSTSSKDSYCKQMGLLTRNHQMNALNEAYSVQSNAVNKEYSLGESCLNKAYSNQTNPLNKEYTRQSKPLEKEYVNDNSTINNEYIDGNMAQNKDFTVHSNNALSRTYINQGGSLHTNQNTSLNNDYTNQSTPLNKDFSAQNEALNKEYTNQSGSTSKDYINPSSSLSKDYSHHTSSLSKDYSNHNNNSLSNSYNSQNNSLNKDYSNQSDSLNKDYTNQSRTIRKDYNQSSSISNDYANHSITISKDYSNQSGSLSKNYSHKSSTLNKKFANPNSCVNKDYSNQSNSIRQDYINHSSSSNQGNTLSDRSLNKDRYDNIVDTYNNQSNSLNKNSYTNQQLTSLNNNNYKNSSLSTAPVLNKEFVSHTDSSSKNPYAHPTVSLHNTASINNDNYPNQNTFTNRAVTLTDESYTNPSNSFNNGSLNKDSFVMTNQDSSVNGSSLPNQSKPMSKELYSTQNSLISKEGFSKSNSLNKQTYRNQSGSSVNKVCQSDCRNTSSGSEYMEVMNQSVISVQQNKAGQISAVQGIPKEKMVLNSDPSRQLNCSLNDNSTLYNVQPPFTTANVSQCHNGMAFEGNSEKRNASNKDNSYNKNNGSGIVCKYTIDSLFKNGDISSRVTISSDSNKKSADNNRTPCKNIMEKRSGAQYELAALPIVADNNLDHGQNQLYQTDASEFSIAPREPSNMCVNIMDGNNRNDVAVANNDNIGMTQSETINNNCKNNNQADKSDKMFNNSSSENNSFNKTDSMLISTNDLMKSKDLDRTSLMPLLDDVRLTTDFSSDLFSSFQVAPGGQHPESMSPTAAFLLAFPLVSTSKTADNINDTDNPENNSATPTTILQIGNIEPSNPDLFQSQVENIRTSKPDEANKEFERFTNYEQNLYESVAHIDNSKRKSAQNFTDQSNNCSDKNFKRCDSRKRARNQTDPLPTYSQSYSYPIFPGNNDFTQFSNATNIVEPRSDGLSVPWAMNISQDFSTQTLVQQKDVCTTTSSKNKERKSTKADKQSSLKTSNYLCQQQSSQSVEYYNLKHERKKQKTSHSKTPVNWMAPLESPKNGYIEPQLSQIEMYPNAKEHEASTLLTNNPNQNVYNNIVSSLEVPFDSVCFSDFGNKKSNNYSWSPSKSLLPQLDNHNFVIPSTLPTLVGDLALGTSTPAETFKSYDDKRYEPPKKADKSSSTYLDNAMASSSANNPKKRSDYNKSAMNHNTFLSVSQLVDPKNQQKQTKMNEINSRKRNENANKHQTITNVNSRREQDQNCIYNQRNEIVANCWNDKHQKNHYKGNYSAESLIGVQTTTDTAETFHLNFNNYQNQNNYFHSDFTDGGNQLHQGQNYQNYFNPQGASHFPTFINEDFSHNVNDFPSNGSQRKKKQKDNSGIYNNAKSQQDTNFISLHKDNSYTLPKESTAYQSGLLAQGYPSCIKSSVPYVSQHTNTTSTLTNFNLSTIFPEMNDQRVGAGSSQASHLNPNFSLPLHSYQSH